MKNLKVLLAHPGTQHSRYLAVELYKRKLLYKFFTGIVIPENNLLIQLALLLVPYKIKSKLKNRFISQVPFNYINIQPLNELKAVKKLDDPKSNREQLFFQRNEVFQKKISSRHIKNVDVIIAFDTAAWVLAKAAKQYGKKLILDQTTAEPAGKAEILERVRKRYPEWQFDLQPRNENYAVTDAVEYNLADKIVVASSYTKDTLIQQNVPEEKIVVNPYGTELQKFYPNNNPNYSTVKFLFVGAVSALKGLPVLLEAWKKIDTTKAELIIVGPVNAEVKKLVEKGKNIKVVGSLAKEELPEVYRSAHVFVFPSFSDGFGQVILEALACGLPVITTENTGGKDLITNNEQGFIIEPGNSKSLVETMNYFIDNRGEIDRMSTNSRERALEFSWDNYGNRWEDIIKEVCKKERQQKCKAI
jgi:alpha-maltose-1-phosphate synthase